MKLIDLLVQELPGVGGWTPESAFHYAAQDADGYVCFYQDEPEYIDKYNHWSCDDSYRLGRVISPIASDFCISIVRRKEYEAAVAASKQPSWNGEGLPPVGTICEALAPAGKGELWSWQRVKVVESGIDGAEKECLVYNLETTMPSWVDEFRPIRTEAERKRDEVVARLCDEAAIGIYLTKDESTAVYDAIASGKIPGVKLEG